ncbi:hypothetical protein [Pseudooceanicola algae]|uniref:hypothetical protein n=1 Tax=Pseudooceanicola algae TaxID=1537215 RepID=UPI0011C4443E|nr:hypothetical protein [Pseudooceanicola algae]
MTLDFNRLLFLLSSASIAIIFLVLAAVAIDLVVPPSGTVGSYVNYRKLAKTLMFLYGTMFAPGVLVAIIYIVYAPSRIHGERKSYALEIITAFVAVQTVFTFTILQDE